MGRIQIASALGNGTAVALTFALAIGLLKFSDAPSPAPQAPSAAPADTLQAQQSRPVALPPPAAPAPAAQGTVLPYDPGQVFDPALSTSLAGASPDGALSVGPDGHFAPDAEAIARFDYFLSALGEMSPEQVRNTLLAHIQQQLPAPAAAEASALLAQYLSFRQQAEQLASCSASPEDMLGIYQQMDQLREQIFGPALSHQLFGEEEQRQATQMERYLIQQRSDLHGAEREAARQALQASLASDEQQTLQKRQQLARLGSAKPDMDRTELQRQRTESFGAEAAQRLAALDDARASWQARLDSYRTRLQQLRADTRMSPAARAHAERALLASRFSPEERLRIAP